MRSPLTEPMESIELVTTADRLRDLRAPWAELWEQCPYAGPFQRPEWLMAWWHWFQPGRLWTVAVHHEGELVGLIPCYLQAEHGESDQVLLLLGVGPSDYLDALVRPQAVPRTLAAFGDRLVSRSGTWCRGEFSDLAGTSPLLRAELPRGLTYERSVGAVCPVLSLPERVEQLARVIPKRQWQKLQYYRRRAAREGTVTVERASAATLDRMLRELLRLHEARWNGEGLPGVLADDRVRGFHREVAPGMLQRGMLRLYALRVNDRAVACLYGFACRGRSYYYLGGFEPELRALSPGMLLVGHAIEEAVREGSREFDFLRGSEAYKYDWGAQDRPTWHVRIRRNEISRG